MHSINILDPVTDVELKDGILCSLEHGQSLGSKKIPDTVYLLVAP